MTLTATIFSMFNLSRPPDPSGRESRSTRSESVTRSRADPGPSVSSCDRAWVAGLFDQFMNGRDKARPKVEQNVVSDCLEPVDKFSLVESDLDSETANPFPPDTANVEKRPLPLPPEYHTQESFDNQFLLSPPASSLSSSASAVEALPKESPSQSFALPYALPSYWAQERRLTEPSIPPLAQTTKAPGKSASKLLSISSRNSFGPLDYGRDDIFGGLDPLLDTDELGPMIQLFKGCLTNNATPEARIEAIRTIITPMQFASGSMVKEDRLYTTLRAALGRYGIDCKVYLPNGSPVWKKLVNLLWPTKYEGFVEAVKVRMAHNGASPHKDRTEHGPVGPSSAFSPDDPGDQQGDDDRFEDDDLTPKIPPSPPVLPPALPTLTKEPETPAWKYE